MNKDVLVVIPFRLNSSRVEKKVLKNIGDIAMCVRVVEQAKKTFSGDEHVHLVVAVDSNETKDLLLKSYSDLEIVLTDPKLPSGTDRVYSAFQYFEKEHPAVYANLCGIMNLQGDMPFIAKHGLQEMVKYFRDNTFGNTKDATMLTLAEKFPSFDYYATESVVKVLCSKSGRALYFSRFTIPYTRKSFEDMELTTPTGMWHIGVYGYNSKALKMFCAQEPVDIEKAESLEQLRALWLDIPIQVITTKADKGESYRGIDTQDDFNWAEKKLRKTETN